MKNEELDLNGRSLGEIEQEVNEMIDQTAVQHILFGNKNVIEFVTLTAQEMDVDISDEDIVKIAMVALKTNAIVDKLASMNEG